MLIQSIEVDPLTARLRQVLLGLTAAAGCCALAACSTTTLRVDPPEPGGVAEQVCIELAPNLPTLVLDEERRETTPPSELTAAWDDIVLRCGVDLPDAYSAAGDIYTINGVDWFAEALTKGTRFTTVGRLANIEVDVPDDYRPEADALVDLGDAIGAHVPVADSP